MVLRLMPLHVGLRGWLGREAGWDGGSSVVLRERLLQLRMRWTLRRIRRRVGALMAVWNRALHLRSGLRVVEGRIGRVGIDGLRGGALRLLLKVRWCQIGARTSNVGSVLGRARRRPG